ncbi:MAG: hypothetical protein BWY92_01834 [Firmicutes bacterium ADurb.BinA052]|nr:MAG: hypothetical protein BWY92_01834 [Firmicutes bacterium ADurb.BinA052]
MTRQHLAVGIDVDALAFRLLQNGLKIREVMAGYQYGVTPHGGDSHASRRRVAVSCGVGLVQHGHYLDVHLADPERHRERVVQREAVAGEEVHGLMEEAVDFGILDSQYLCVIGVSSHSFQAEQSQVRYACGVRAHGG